MKQGDVVRYSKHPHEELHRSGMMGLVIREAYSPESYPDFDPSEMLVDVLWSDFRGLQYPAGTVSWEYLSEIEVVFNV